MAVWKYQLLKRGGEIWLAGPEGGLYPEALGEEAVGKCGGARYVRSSCAQFLLLKTNPQALMDMMM